MVECCARCVWAGTMEQTSSKLNGNSQTGMLCHIQFHQPQSYPSHYIAILHRAISLFCVLCGVTTDFALFKEWNFERQWQWANDQKHRMKCRKGLQPDGECRIRKMNIGKVLKPIAKSDALCHPKQPLWLSYEFTKQSAAIRWNSHTHTHSLTYRTPFLLQCKS